jgi:hypothetical protein
MRNLLLLGFLFLYGATQAQVYNTGTFYVGSGTIYYCNGNFINTAGASYQNDGVMYISGNVTNSQSAMPAGAGTTVFNGTAAQTLSGSSSYRNLDITLDNASGLTLANRLAVGDGTGGILTFTSGRITSGTNTQDVYFYPGSAYTGYDATHHIIGYVTKSGSTQFDYPIGDGSHTADLTISGLTGDADFQVLYTGSGYGTYAVQAPLVTNGVFRQEWWNLSETAGSVSAQVALHWNDARQTLNHSNPGSLVVAHFTGGVWTSAGGTSTSSAGSSTGTVGPSNALGSFSPFTFGSTAMPLPITLSTFTVDNDNCAAYLTWTTTLELNAASFDIQQSTDAVNFITVATVKAEDTASSYHTTIAQQSRQAFYRLKLNDLGGTSTYSGVDALDLTCLPAAQQLSVYPNPVSTGALLQARLISADARGMGDLQVYDAVGRRVYSTMVTVSSGTNLYSIPMTGLPQGIYTIVVVGNGWRSDVIGFSRTGN